MDWVISLQIAISRTSWSSAIDPAGLLILPPIVARQVFLTPKDSVILRFCSLGTDFSGTGITPCKRIFLDRLP